MVKTIPNYPDYAITKDGQIWSKRKWKWLKLSPHKQGYLMVNLRKKWCKIHRLVLETFIGKCPPNMECRHLNSVKTDNRLENLCWGTKSENACDAVKHGTHYQPKNQGENHGMTKFVEQDVRRIIYMWKTKLFTQVEIANLYNVSQTTIKNIVNKLSWKHIWR